MRAIKAQVISPETFVRLPWVVVGGAARRSAPTWPGPTLLGLVGAALTGGTATTRVLKPSGGVTLPDGGAGLTVCDAEKQAEVERFLRGLARTRPRRGRGASAASP